MVTASRETETYDFDYRPENLADQGKAAVQNLTYGYDAANNVTTIANGVTSANNQTLGYDVLDRLMAAKGGYGNFGWTYDANGNRLTEKQGSSTAVYGYAANSNRLGTINAGPLLHETFSTTAAGNISGLALDNIPVLQYAYNQAGRLATAKDIGLPVAEYTYDGFGERVAKSGAATGVSRFTYSVAGDAAGRLLEDADGSGDARVDYIYLDGRPIGTYQPSDNKFYFLHDDRLGTPQLATDANQKTAWSATYQPFGFTATGAAGLSRTSACRGRSSTSKLPSTTTAGEPTFRLWAGIWRAIR